MCFVYFSQQSGILSLNRVIFVMCVYCEVGTEFVDIIRRVRKIAKSVR
jgi:hypothetical protein